MVHALLMLASTEGEESSKAAFYIVGGLFAVFAVLVSVVGMRSPDFPGTASAQKALAALTVVLMAGAMATAVLTS